MSISKMNNRKINILLLVSFLFIIVGCAHMNRIYSIPDIIGSWEGIGLGYYALDIRENGVGLFVIVFEDEIIETYEITNFDFQKGKFIGTFESLERSNGLIKFEGTLLGEDLMILRESENDNGDISESMYFLRESSVPELRKKAKQKIEQISKDSP